MGHDFSLSNCGSFSLLVPHTEDADAWAKENLPYAIQHGGGYVASAVTILNAQGRAAIAKATAAS